MLIKSVYEQAAIKQSPSLHPRTERERQTDRERPGKYLSPIIVPAKLEAKNGVDTTNIGFIIALVHRYAAFSIHWTLNDGLYEQNEQFYSLCHTGPGDPDGNHRTQSISAKTLRAKVKIFRSCMRGTRVT